MDFNQLINEYEDNINKFAYISKEGKVPIMLTAVHTVMQTKGATPKLPEPYTAAICQYVGDIANASYFIKAVDDGIDSNSIGNDEFKQVLLKKIKDNNIKLLIDIHGAHETNNFDVEIGTLDNMSIEQSTETALIDCFKNNGINNIELNNPFKGGGITRYIYENTEIDIIQLEINHAYRSSNNINECQKICDSLIEFAEVAKTFY